MKDKLLKIINHYGICNQLKYIHSEYFELDEAIMNYEFSKSFRDKFLVENIAEEIADVMVMLKQFQYKFNISNEEILNIMNFKIDRQIKRIEEEEKNDSID